MAQAAQSTRILSARRLKVFVLRRLSLGHYLRRPGDGRLLPQIPAEVLLWSQLICYVLREVSFLAIEALVRSSARRAIGVSRGFGDDALAYFTQRLDPLPTRQALAAVLHRAKRNKAFDDSRFIGLALDGTSAGRNAVARCLLCHAVKDAKHNVVGYRHHFSVISVVGTKLSLPFDIEPYGPGDSEYAASQRLLTRAIALLGPRFADYVVGDGAYATAPFLHSAQDLGLQVIARLKANLPELYAAAEKRFRSMPPSLIFQAGADLVEIWDADDFDPWDSLRWTTVRVIRYRQRKRNGTIVEAYWLTDFSTKRVSARTLYALAKSRWEIENQVFNDGKNRYGMKHVTHHHQNSLLITWLLIIFAVTIERLFRLRYLHRGTRSPYTPIELLRLFRLSLSSGPIPSG